LQFTNTITSTYICAFSRNHGSITEGLENSVGIHQLLNIKNHFVGKSEKRHGGKPTILTREEKEEIVIMCQVMQEIGFGITHEMVRNVVMDYLKDKGRQNPFVNDRLGNDWWLGFMQRWPKLVERKPQHLPANHATALTEGAINAWIMKVKAMVNEAGLGKLTTEELAQRLWNIDKSAFATDVTSKRVLA